MILWLVLFVLVVATSFVLAMQSMHDYHESPKNSAAEYGLFLIRNVAGLTWQVLDSIHSQIIKEGFVISLERIIKGSKAALVIFGPKNVLTQLSPQLNLLELEDYTEVNTQHTTAWEVGIKDNLSTERKINNFFSNFPVLTQAEQFWWQLVLQAKPSALFQSHIRAVVFSYDSKRREKLSQVLQNLPQGHLIKVPKPYVSGQIVQFYQQRSLGQENTNPVLTTEEILKLLLLK